MLYAQSRHFTFEGGRLSPQCRILVLFPQVFDNFFCTACWTESVWLVWMFFFLDSFCCSSDPRLLLEHFVGVLALKENIVVGRRGLCILRSCQKAIELKRGRQGAKHAQRWLRVEVYSFRHLALVQLIDHRSIHSQLKFGMLVWAFQESKRLSLAVFRRPDIRLVNVLDKVDFGLSYRLHSRLIVAVFLEDLDHEVCIQVFELVSISFPVDSGKEL